MIGLVLRKIFGTKNDRVVAALRPLVGRVNELESSLKALTDDALRAKTAELRERVLKGQPLSEVQPEAFAVVREAGRRVLNMRHFDVQLIGGAVLNEGRIAEMRTGEGKTLVATLPAYLNSLSGKGVHVVTVNDYLARRDAEWMGKLYNFLGLSVGVVVVGMGESERKKAYGADITYGQNNEFGFDYLRDNMKYQQEDLVQRGYNFAVVDEVDSILIDEARTPLIISGPAEESTDKYHIISRIIPQLIEGTDFEIDLKSKQPTLTEQGISHVERLLSIPNLYDPAHTEFVHHVNQALRARVTMIRDVDYVVKDGDVIIVDEFTGRLMPGRRWSDGLHQAVEAKEGLRVARENRTLASVSFQNYFRMYSKLSGMTGTADTEAVEFKNIYNLDVVVIPTNQPMVREDSSDRVYRTRKEKYDAVVEDIEETHKTGQPILVGTISIEQSESLSKLLTAKNVPHDVLNAKHHEREAEIIAQAGRFGSVTISTNMAGRGTDIILGGNPDFMAQSEAKTKDRNDEGYKAALDKFSKSCAEEHDKVVAAGGLYVLGTERHESRRIDNQLRGRAGRQGDPGLSRFYISLEDDLMRRFGGEKIQMLMERLGWDEGASIDGYLISSSIETAQKRVEGFHFDVRKHLLEYDDVMNKQRQAIYAFRSRILHHESMREEILSMVDDLVEENVLSVCDERVKPGTWDLSQLVDRFKYLFNAPLVLEDTTTRNHQVLFDLLRTTARSVYAAHLSAQEVKLAEIRTIMVENPNYSINLSRAKDKPLSFETVEQDTCLEAVDHLWIEHLQEMDHLRDGIGLRGYGQKNPLHEYQREGFQMFQKLLGNLKEAIVRRLYFYQVPEPKELFAAIEAEQKRREAMEQQMNARHQSTLEPQPPQNGTQSAGKGGDQDPNSSKAKLDAARRERRKMSRR